MPSWMCCTAKGCGGRSREESYKVAEGTGEKKYTWEDRDMVDISRYKMTGLEGKLEVRRDIAGQQFIIENCKDSVLLVLDHTATVTMDDCDNCLVVIGPCSGSVFVRDCTNCTVMAVCQQLRTRDCQNLTLALHCITNPIIENSRPVVFHPIHLDYEGIQENMQAAKLSPFANNSSNVHDFTPDKYTPNYNFSPNPLPIKKAHASLLEGYPELLFDSLSSFFVLRPKSREPDSTTAQKSIIYTTQSTSETVEAFYERCLTINTAARRKSIACEESHDVLAIKGDVQQILHTNTEFVSGHVVALCLAGKDCPTVARQLCDEYPDWQVVDASFQDQFKKTIEKLSQASLSAFYERCLTINTAARRKSIACEESHDVLAIKGDVQQILHTNTEFVSGHVVALCLAGKDCPTVARQLCDEYPDWQVVDASFQDQFKKTIEKLSQASLSV